MGVMLNTVYCMEKKDMYKGPSRKNVIQERLVYFVKSLLGIKAQEGRREEGRGGVWLRL